MTLPVYKNTETFEITVKIGDNWTIASQRAYGRQDLWQEILPLNAEILSDAQLQSFVFLTELTLTCPVLAEDIYTEQFLPDWRV